MYLLVVIAPVTHADAIRKAMAAAGAGRIGNYDSCSFSNRGTGRFRPNDDALPAIGLAGRLEEVEEERIEVAVLDDDLKAVLKAIVKAHPYEEPAIYVLPMENYKDVIK
ncbi:MAG: hypothetical protein ABIG34_05055 [Candidatus Peregrinibacteria bacterium]